MPQAGLIIRAFVGSPTDVADERKIIPEVVQQWNIMYSREKSAIVHAVLWETHASPNLDAPAQEVINRDLLEHCDFLIAVFWTTLGGGGTVTEIEKALKAAKRVILYFSEKPIPQDKLNTNEWTRREAYRTKMSGLYNTFKTDQDLRERLLRDINDAVSQILRIRSDDRPFRARLIGRTEIPNPGHGASRKTGIYDWIEVTIQSNGKYIDKADGRAGQVRNGTGAIEAMFTNTAVDVAKNKVVEMRPLPGSDGADLNSATATSFSGDKVGWGYRFDLGLTNEPSANRYIVAPINRNIQM